jgi:hypothetical protein
MRTQLVGMYELFKLGRKQGGGYDLNHKTKDRDLHPVHHSFVEESNANSQINGLLYIENKEATSKYWSKGKEFTPFVEVPKTPLTPEIQEVHNKLSEMTKDELIEFAEKNDFKVKKTKSAENILAELIEQIDVKN